LKSPGGISDAHAGFPWDAEMIEAAYVEATCNANCIGLVKLPLGRVRYGSMEDWWKRT